MAADLFTLADLASALQVDAVDPAAGDLVRRRVTARIQAEVGPLVDPVPAAIWEVALTVAARVYGNPGGFKSETIGSYTYVRESDGTAGVYLTSDERRLIRRELGIKTATTIPIRSTGFEDAFVVPVV